MSILVCYDVVLEAPEKDLAKIPPFFDRLMTEEEPIEILAKDFNIDDNLNETVDDTGTAYEYTLAELLQDIRDYDSFNEWEPKGNTLTFKICARGYMIDKLRAVLNLILDEYEIYYRVDATDQGFGPVITNDMEDKYFPESYTLYGDGSVFNSWKEVIEYCNELYGEEEKFTENDDFDSVNEKLENQGDCLYEIQFGEEKEFYNSSCEDDDDEFLDFDDD